jgi:hypothetical protein
MSASTPETRTRKLPSTAWKPGQSGNPLGRPRHDYDIAAMCREHAPEAVATLVAALKDPRHKIAAAQTLLDRGFGRPVQPIEGDGANGIVLLHRQAAELVSQEIIAAMEQREPPMINARVEPDSRKDLLLQPPPSE